MSDHVLWTEVYRPHRVADAILPESVRSVCQGFVDQGLILNVLMVGPPGVGKTTVAKAICEELDADWYLVNSSLSRNIDTLRTDIADFASGVSVLGGRKYVILDEADHLNPTSFQPALRAFMEEYASNCGFIMTCNWPEKIIPPLRDSRMTQIDFRPHISDEEKARLMMSFFKVAEGILTKEEVAFKKEALAGLVSQCFPDWRQCINRLQTYASKNGRTIDEGILVKTGAVDLSPLVTYMKAKNFTGAREVGR
jgi:DNA polymerase III delta prime subunit